MYVTRNGRFNKRPQITLKKEDHYRKKKRLIIDFYLPPQEVLDPPAIAPSSQYQLSLAFPDLGQHKVQDLFSGLGPVAIFSAKHHWSAPRSARLKKRDNEGYGFSVRGDAPVIIAGVDIGSIAEVRNLLFCHFLFSVANYVTMAET